MENNNHRAQGTGDNEWYTPIEYIDAARSVLGIIDLDPASSPIANEIVKAKLFYTKEDNGLSKEWHGKIWLNPPYSQPHIVNFVYHLVNEIQSEHVYEAILLTHNYTDTKWFHHAAANASGMCFTKGRIRFHSPDGKKAAPTQGQTFFYYGNNYELFKEVFSPLGLVVKI